MTVSDTDLPSSQSDGEQPLADGVPVAAKPDVESTPSDSKQANVFHEEPSSSGTEIQVRNGEHGNGDVSMEDGPSELHIDDGNTKSPNDLAGPPVSASGDAETQPQASSSQADGIMYGRDNEENDDASPAVQAVPLAEEIDVSEEWWDLKMTWSGKTFDLRVGGNDMVYDFRLQICLCTGVPIEGQKVIGLLPRAKGKLGPEHDAKRFGHLGVKKGSKFVLIGTRVDERFKDRVGPGNELFDDFDVTYSNKAQPKPNVVSQADDPRNKRKVKEIIDRIPITVMNEPREGKKLLVLDLDYTIVDTKPLISGALPSEECARPGLHEFLEQVYPHYDIVIWSQTHWRWLETKLVELGMIGGTRNYKVAFVSDRTTMFPVFTQRDGQPYKHEVKPLAYFWARFPHWSPKNTIHIDDLSRNFALNPGEGLRIRAFNKAGQPEGLADRELQRLGRYLVNIANNVEDFTSLDHSNWKRTTPRQG
ncbi:HAD hydrolase, family IIID [Kwoniella sp. CBS 9459]